MKKRITKTISMLMATALVFGMTPSTVLADSQVAESATTEETQMLEATGESETTLSVTGREYSDDALSTDEGYTSTEKEQPEDILSYENAEESDEEAEIVTIDGIMYQLDDETDTAAIVKAVDEDITEVNVSTIAYEEKEYRVTSVGEWAFIDRNKIKTVDMSYVTSVGDCAFTRCQSLISVNLPSAITVGGWAFSQCESMISVNMPSATTLGEMAFEYCSSLESVNLPKARELGESAFMFDESLVSLDLPNVEIVGEDAFHYCTKLQSINLPKATDIGVKAFCLDKVLESVNIPMAIHIRDSAFEYCDALASIDLPNATDIGERGFEYCWKLREINLPKVKRIGAWSFASCISLKYVDMPVVTTIEEYSFIECGYLNKLTIPASVESIKTDVFWDCNRLKELVVLSNGEIHKNAFSDLSAYRLVLDPSWKEREDGPILLEESDAGEYPYLWKGGRFASLSYDTESVQPDKDEDYDQVFCNGITYKLDRESYTATIVDVDKEWKGSYLETNSVSIPCKNYDDPHIFTVTAIRPRAFENNHTLTEISLPEVVSIGEAAFKGCDALTTIHIQSVENIGKEAFDSCSKLESLVMPSSIRWVDEHAFAHCSALKKIKVNNICPISEDAFEGVMDGELLLPKEWILNYDRPIIRNRRYYWKGGFFRSYSAIEDSDNLPATPGNPGDPSEEELICRSEAVVSVSEGSYKLYLKQKLAGTYTFEAVEDGWAIQDEQGYLTVEKGKLQHTEQPVAWTYKNGGFAKAVKTKLGVHCRTNDYYLASAASVSLVPVKAELRKEVASVAHTYAEWEMAKNGTHTRTCSACHETETVACEYDAISHECICGRYDPAYKSVTATVEVKKSVKRVLFHKIPVYTYTITPVTVGTDAVKVEYYIKGIGWKCGRSFTSVKKLKQFQIRITDSEHTVTTLLYHNGEVTVK